MAAAVDGGGVSSAQSQREFGLGKDLARNCILIHGARRDLVVLDPFLGIGSSALAALDCGVETFIGFDLEEEYVRIAKAALNNATPPLFGPEAF
jgi:DNA modification methylase